MIVRKLVVLVCLLSFIPSHGHAGFFDDVLKGVTSLFGPKKESRTPSLNSGNSVLPGIPVMNNAQDEEIADQIWQIVQGGNDQQKLDLGSILGSLGGLLGGNNNGIARFIPMITDLLQGGRPDLGSIINTVLGNRIDSRITGLIDGLIKGEKLDIAAIMDIVGIKDERIAGIVSALTSGDRIDLSQILSVVGVNLSPQIQNLVQSLVSGQRLNIQDILNALSGLDPRLSNLTSLIGSNGKVDPLQALQLIGVGDQRLASLINMIVSGEKINANNLVSILGLSIDPKVAALADLISNRNDKISVEDLLQGPLADLISEDARGKISEIVNKSKKVKKVFDKHSEMNIQDLVSGQGQLNIQDLLTSRGKRKLASLMRRDDELKIMIESQGDLKLSEVLKSSVIVQAALPSDRLVSLGGKENDGILSVVGSFKGDLGVVTSGDYSEVLRIANVGKSDISNLSLDLGGHVRVLNSTCSESLSVGEICEVVISVDAREDVSESIDVGFVNGSSDDVLSIPVMATVVEQLTLM